MSHRLLILCYHNVTTSWMTPFEDGAANLDAQLRRVRAVANVVPLGPAVADLLAGQPLPARAVALTFDDGYRDNLDVGVPLLERLGLPATFFLTPGLLSGESHAWWETLGHAWSTTPRPTVAWDGSEMPTRGAAGVAALAQVCDDLKRETRQERNSTVATLVERLDASERQDRAPLFLDWEGARELVARGFEVGSHTMSHPLLSREVPAEQLHQLAESRALLEEKLGVPVTLLAYPNGRRIDFDARTQQAAADAGYTHAFTSIFGWNRPGTPPYELRRVIVEPNSGLKGLVNPFRYAATDRIRSRRSRGADPS